MMWDKYAGPELLVDFWVPPCPLLAVVTAADHACNLCVLYLLHVLLLCCYSR